MVAPPKDSLLHTASIVSTPFLSVITDALREAYPHLEIEPLRTVRNATANTTGTHPQQPRGLCHLR